MANSDHTLVVIASVVVIVAIGGMVAGAAVSRRKARGKLKEAIIPDGSVLAVQVETDTTITMQPVPQHVDQPKLDAHAAATSNTPGVSPEPQSTNGSISGSDSMHPTTEPEIPEPYEYNEGRFFTSIMRRLRGSVNHGYEDAAGVDPLDGAAAIADGTTLGGRSDIVARSLVYYWVTERFRLDQESERTLWWELASRRWYLETGPAFNSMTATEQLKWGRGGSSTFMAIRMQKPHTYRFYHIGDCTLFWFRDGKHRTTQGATKHGSNPDVLHTSDKTASQLLVVEPEAVILGDVALMTTDALAKYLLAYSPWETDPDFWVRIEHGLPAEFEQWAVELRDSQKLDSDDYTLVMLRFPDSSVAAADASHADANTIEQTSSNIADRQVEGTPKGDENSAVPVESQHNGSEPV